MLAAVAAARLEHKTNFKPRPDIGTLSSSLAELRVLDNPFGLRVHCLSSVTTFLGGSIRFPSSLTVAGELLLLLSLSLVR